MFFILITTISGAFPFVFGFLNKEFKRGKFKILHFYFLLSVVTNIVIFYYYYFSLNNIYLINTFSIVEFSLLFIFFFKTISIPKQYKLFIIITSILIQTCLTLFANSNEVLRIPSFSYSSISIIILILILLFKYLSSEAIVSYFSILDFWIIISYLIYFAGTFLLFLSTIIIHDEQILKNMWIINNSLSLTTNLLISFGLWKTR